MQSYITNQLQQQSTNSAKMRPVLLWQPQCSCNKENLTAPPVGHKKGGGICVAQNATTIYIS